MQPKQAPLAPVALGRLPERPLLSVIVPSYNQGRYIRATIESILGQSYRPIEVIVMDGGSTDETVEVLKGFDGHPEIRWVSERDKGVVDAVNKGFAQVTGDVVAIQSSDDCYLPGALERVIAELRGNDRLGLVYGDTVKVDEHGAELQRHVIGPYSLENLFLFRTWIPQPSAFFRRELLDALGGWDERIPYAPDTDLWIRMAFRTEVRKLDAYLSARRVHGEQRDTQAAKIVRDYTRLIDQSPDIQASSRALRDAARASRHLIRVRYNASGSDWYAAWHSFRAGMSCAESRNTGSVVRLLALPARRVLSRLKRTVLRASPTGHNAGRTPDGGR